MLTARLGHALTRIAALRPGPRLRGWLRIAGLGLLAAGAAWSLATLDIAIADLALWPLLLNALLLSPANLVLAGLTLRLSAAALGCAMPVRRAITRAAQAGVAELLPLPGGAAVRGAALIEAGVRAGPAAWMVLASAVLMLGLTVALASLALALLGEPLGWAGLLAGLLVTALALWHIAGRVGARWLPALIGIRAAALALAALQLLATFAALGQEAALLQVLVYTLAPALGATIAIVPGGFGVNEAVAAALASIIAASPTAAFLAVALNRALGLCAGAALAGLLTRAGR